MSKRILVLSAHASLDRRIIAEMNTLAASGYDVTFLTVPVEIPQGSVDPRIRILTGQSPETITVKRHGLIKSAYQGFKNILKATLPQPIVLALRDWRQRRARRADPLIKLKWFQAAVDSHTSFFHDHAPAEFDVIHCHDLETLPGAVHLRQAKNPHAWIIYDSHELFPYQNEDELAQQFWSKLERQYIAQANLIITVNASIAQLMQEMYQVPKPAVIFNSYSLLEEPAYISRDKFHELFGTTEQGFKVLFQGSLSEYRNLPNLVRAFHLLGDEYRLFVIGTGPYEAEMRAIQKELGLKNIYFGGWVAQEHLISYTRHADLGVIPYVAKPGVLNMQYCTPNKLFEFIESCIPICSSDLPELKRLLTECGNGGAYAMTTPDEIATAIRESRRRIEAKEFPRSVLDQAREACSWAKQANHLVALYQEMLAIPVVVPSTPS